MRGRGTALAVDEVPIRAPDSAMNSLSDAFDSDITAKIHYAARRQRFARRNLEASLDIKKTEIKKSGVYINSALYLSYQCQPVMQILDNDCPFGAATFSIERPFDRLF